MSEGDDNVTAFRPRPKPAPLIGDVMVVTMPPIVPRPGPFTVTIADAQGKMFEVVFPDHTGVLPQGDPALGTIGHADLAVNLLAGALRVFAGAP